jgi:hypothetical protein
MVLGTILLACNEQGTDPATTQVRQALKPTGLTRSPWQMHAGLEVTDSNPDGLVQFLCNPTQHGQICEYDDATIPPDGDPGWGPAPNGETIGLHIGCGGSLVCKAPVQCMAYGDFTYFQTLVNIPLNVVVSQFSITFSGMDDGSRVSIFNSQYPNGLVIPGSYVYLGGSGTTNLAAYVIAGEINRVVVTQVDDCCCENYLDSAQVVLNGEVVHTGCTSAAECDDGNACTSDVCNADGSCDHPAASCDDGDLCTTDSCDPALGCGHQPVSCDDSSLCTTDSCNPATGCENQPVNCDDGVACTLDSCSPANGCSHVDQCPDCSHAAATVATIWPPNHELVPVGVQGVTDPQGQSTTIRVDCITQDEPTNTVGDGNTCPDADGVGTPTAQVRAERTGSNKVPGDGRVYHIAFTAMDPDGYSCTGEVTSCVPHDQGAGAACVDQGKLYDSLVCQ